VAAVRRAAGGDDPELQSGTPSTATPRPLGPQRHLFPPAVLILLLLVAGALQLRAWRSLASRELRGELPRRTARLRFGATALAPAVLLAGVFAGVLALDRSFAGNLVSEMTVRALPVAIVVLAVLGLLVWAAFALRRPR